MFRAIKVRIQPQRAKETAPDRPDPKPRVMCIFRGNSPSAMFRLSFLGFLISISLSIHAQSLPSLHTADHPLLRWQGRTYAENGGVHALAGSAASLTFRCTGNTCKIHMANQSPEWSYNYFSVIVDGERSPRIALQSRAFTTFDLPITSTADYHTIEIHKETEASCGQILIQAIEVDSLLEWPKSTKPKIEFIGNSITAGMASDTVMIPCGAGSWFDQHNAYDAFGPTVARALDCDYMLSAVSGMGMYRNWNSDSPVMKDVYESTTLSDDPASPRWDVNSFRPDIIVIGLGTNDFSEGDHVTPRLPFDEEKFIDTYFLFLKKIFTLQPQASIVITNSAIFDYRRDIEFTQYLNQIKLRAKLEIPDMLPVTIFKYSLFEALGCSYHPVLSQHAQMAAELNPVLQQILEAREK